MKSTITLFYKSLVNKEKNFVLDDGNGNSRLEQYLSTLQKVVINDFQYIKIQLSLSIKIDMNQTNLEMIDSKDLNYVKIQNGTEKPYYYFVVSKTWRSKETIELVLSMDTLNSFKFNEDYHINSKTLTKRMHKDRFDHIIKVTLDYTQVSSEQFEGLAQDVHLPYEVEVYESGSIVKTIKCYGIYKPSQQIIELENISEEDTKYLQSYPNAYFTEIDMVDENLGDVQFFGIPKSAFTFSYGRIKRKIDLKSEDISCPVYKTKESPLQESYATIDWSLYYKNSSSDPDSPVDCYLVTSQLLKFNTPSASRVINASDLPDGKIIFICPQYNGQVNFKINGQTKSVYTEEEIDIYERWWMYHCLAFRNDNGVLEVLQYIGQQDQGQNIIYVSGPAITRNASVEFIGSQDTIVGFETDAIASSYNTTQPSNIFKASASNYTFTFSSSIIVNLNTKSSIDKTLSENLKIINVPYCPSSFSINNDVITISPLWTYDSTYKFLRLTDLNGRFNNTIVSNVNSILDYFNSRINFINTSLYRKMKDSKLYHSDYFRPKFVYDSFSRVFPLEQINYQQSLYAMSQTSKFEFTFVMSRNIVSKFLFKFNYVYDHSNEDYPNVVAVARNNEEVLYSSSYLNYIRTGYNYDLKAKERSETASAIGIGLNIAGLIASIGLSFVPGGQAIGVAGVVASGLGIANQLVNYAKTVSQNEENIQRKLQESNRQAVSVLNADDYDLLYEYSSNKAKLCLYEVSPKMQEVLDDLFYYAGYIVNEQMVPVINSRYWFNFVQASLIIDDSSNLTSEIEDDIKEKFEQGVTFLHYHNKFDFKQEMENWETSLLE